MKIVFYKSKKIGQNILLALDFQFDVHEATAKTSG